VKPFHLSAHQLYFLQNQGPAHDPDGAEQPNRQPEIAAKSRRIHNSMTAKLTAIVLFG
jgi:hypothetical protein